MNLLILVENYPKSDNRYPMAYVHSRVLDYISLDDRLSIKILSFNTEIEYFFEGVNVIPEKDFVSEWPDLVISHAPNIKNHKRFITKHDVRKVLFFIHGHEVLNYKNYYPKPYPFLYSERIKRLLFSFYDLFKLPKMNSFLSSSQNFGCVFVSEWMKKEAFTSLKMKKYIDSSVIYNPINNIFASNNYKKSITHEYDFITVRPFDGSKYCIDQVVELAKSHCDLKFLLVGRGRYFEHNPAPENLTIINRFMDPIELCDYLDKSRCALMPTKLDAQGVMMCEMASYGIPLITSDIEICKEVLKGYKGAFFISHKALNISSEIINSINKLQTEQSNDLLTRGILRERFGISATTGLEISLFKDWVCK